MPTDPKLMGMTGTLTAAVEGTRELGDDINFGQLWVAGRIARKLAEAAKDDLSEGDRKELDGLASQAEFNIAATPADPRTFVEGANSAVNELESALADPNFDPTYWVNIGMDGAPYPEDAKVPKRKQDIFDPRALRAELDRLRTEVVGQFNSRRGPYRTGANRILGLGGWRREGLLLNAANFGTAGGVAILADWLIPRRGEEDAFGEGGIFESFPDQVTDLLATMRGMEAVEARRRLMQTATDPRVVIWLIRSFVRGVQRDDETLAAIAGVMATTRWPEVAAEAARALGSLTADSRIPDLLRVAGDRGRPAEIRVQAILALRTIGASGPEVEAALREAAQDRSGPVRAQALISLAYMQADIGPLVEDAKDARQPEVRIAAAIAATAITDREAALAILAELLQDRGSWHVRAAAVDSCGMLAPIDPRFGEILVLRTDPRGGTVTAAGRPVRVDGPEEDREVRLRIERLLLGLGLAARGTQAALPITPNVEVGGNVVIILDISGSMTQRVRGTGPSRTDVALDAVEAAAGNAAASGALWNILLSVDRFPSREEQERRDPNAPAVPGRPARPGQPAPVAGVSPATASRRMFREILGRIDPRRIGEMLGRMRAAAAALGGGRGDLKSDLDEALEGVDLSAPGGLRGGVQSIIIVTDGNPTAGPFVTSHGILENVRRRLGDGIAQVRIDLIGIGHFAQTEGVTPDLAREFHGVTDFLSDVR